MLWTPTIVLQRCGVIKGVLWHQNTRFTLSIWGRQAGKKQKNVDPDQAHQNLMPGQQGCGITKFDCLWTSMWSKATFPTKIYLPEN